MNTFKKYFEINKFLRYNFYVLFGPRWDIQLTRGPSEYQSIKVK